ncbi:hypothetical protein C2E23DRAFT_158528 [Lenzites betulinus]|nr:hypothetical protein C2E23DRAFT_158096 [Lenzites betulinus]KAH9858003.1 hypothetical protein C2E23DRAFT_158528 [Lenzites betulinus]
MGESLSAADFVISRCGVPFHSHLDGDCLRHGRRSTSARRARRPAPRQHETKWCIEVAGSRTKLTTSRPQRIRPCVVLLHESLPVLGFPAPGELQVLRTTNMPPSLSTSEKTIYLSISYMRTSSVRYPWQRTDSDRFVCFTLGGESVRDGRQGPRPRTTCLRGSCAMARFVSSISARASLCVARRATCVHDHTPSALRPTMGAVRAKVASTRDTAR